MENLTNLQRAIIAEIDALTESFGAEEIYKVFQSESETGAMFIIPSFATEGMQSGVEKLVKSYYILFPALGKNRDCNQCMPKTSFALFDETEGIKDKFLTKVSNLDKPF